MPDFTPSNHQVTNDCGNQNNSQFSGVCAEITLSQERVQLREIKTEKETLEIFLR